MFVCLSAADVYWSELVHLCWILLVFVVHEGLWLMQRWKKSGSLQQLSLKDADDPRNSFLYRLARNSELHNFRYVILSASAQDRYVPLHSARIEMCRAALKDPTVLGDPSTSLIKHSFIYLFIYLFVAVYGTGSYLIAKSYFLKLPVIIYKWIVTLDVTVDVWFATGTIYQEMVHYILNPLLKKENVSFIRYDIHHALPSTANALIGRAAHIAVLDSELFIEKFLLVVGSKYFQ